MKKGVVGVLLIVSFVLVFSALEFFVFDKELRFAPTIEERRLDEKQINNFFNYAYLEFLEEGQRDDIFPYGNQNFNPLLLRNDIVFSQELEQQKYDGYIIRLNEEPLVVTYKKNKLSTNLQEKLNKQKTKITKEQDNTKRKLLQINSDVKIKNRFTKVINAVVVNELKKEDVERLKSEGYKVSPNYKVYATLMDSVPLINADDVWEYCRPGGNECENVGGNGLTGAATKEVEACLVFSGDEIDYTKAYTGGGALCLTGRGITIGIIDTGVDYTHEDLGSCTTQQFLNGNCDKVIDGFDFVNSQDVNGDGDYNDPEDIVDRDPMDDYGHGTHVAATAAGNGVLKGVAPDASIVGYKVLSSYGSGSDSDIIAAIERSADPNQDGDFLDHLDVISMSLGGGGDPDDDVSLAIDNVVDLGVVAVISAGNSGPYKETILSPGTARRAITVGAVDKNLEMAYFSSRGPVVWKDENEIREAIIKPDIVAPGLEICAAQWDNWLEGGEECSPELEGHIAISGTSMAAPHVSGLAALIKQKNPSYTSEQIKTIIKNTAELLPNGEKVTTQGFGVVDAMNSVFSEEPIIVALDAIEQDSLEIDITGKIEGNNFEYYELSHAPDLPLSELDEDDWTLITSSGSIPANGVLYENLDSLTLSSPSIIRLRVHDENNNHYDDYGYFKFNKFKFIEPLNYDTINPKNDLRIRLENIFNYPIDNFYVEYSFNDGPPTNNGIVIDNQNVLEARLLANTLTEDGTLLIIAYVELLNGIRDTVEVEKINVDTTLKESWPVRLNFDSGQDGYLIWPGYLQTTIGNVLGDDNEEVVVPFMGNQQKVLIYDQEGNLLQSIVVALEDAAKNYQDLVLVNLDDDEYDEIIFPPLVENAKLYLYSFNGDGSILFNSQIEECGTSYFSNVMAADLDKDGQTEIILKNNNAFNGENKLCIISQEGVVLSSMSLGQYNYYATSWEYFSTPAVGNFDMDGDLEIVVATIINGGYDEQQQEFVNEGRVYVYNKDGTLVNGWPIDVPGLPVNSPVVGDVDNDGNDDIIFALYYQGTFDTNYGGVHVLNKNGQYLTGWPVEMGSFLLSVSLVDIDENDDLEIAANGFGKIYLFNKQGNILNGWPVYVNYPGSHKFHSSFGSINNGGIGLSTESNRRVYAFDVNGNLLEGYPKISETGASSAPVLFDLDQDNLVEIITSSNNEFDFVEQKYKNRGSIYIWETDSPYVEENQEWPRFHHDKQLTGLYTSEETESNCPVNHIDNGDGTCTAIIEASLDDSLFLGQADTWQYVRDSPNGNIFGTPRVASHIGGNKYYNYRSFFSFDTLSISGNIIEAKLSGYPWYIRSDDGDSEDYIVLLESTQLDPMSLTNSDYQRCGFLNNSETGGQFDMDDIIVDERNEFILDNTGISFIKLNDWTMLCLRTGNDILNIEPVGGGDALDMYGVNDPDSEKRPKLIVTYET
ncbi:S8 family serine peptidase [Candidatus Pacearchaeota archaeon]|nr:S8 family serine peptidase [Candidatus Pacearchaeota archaeon]